MIIQQTKNAQYFLTLPIQIVRAMEWNKGDEIKVYIDKAKKIVLSKAKDQEEA